MLAGKYIESYSMIFRVFPLMPTFYDTIPRKISFAGLWYMGGFSVAD